MSVHLETQSTPKKTGRRVPPRVGNGTTAATGDRKLDEPSGGQLRVSKIITRKFTSAPAPVGTEKVMHPAGR